MLDKPIVNAQAMGSILDLGKEHLPHAIAGDVEALAALFQCRVTGWGKTYAHEEELTVGLFSDLEQNVEPFVAFALVPEAVEIAASADDFDRFNCALDLVASLVVASETTEIPPRLREKLPELERKANACGREPISSVSVIRAHYRNAL